MQLEVFNWKEGQVFVKVRNRNGQIYSICTAADCLKPHTARDANSIGYGMRHGKKELYNHSIRVREGIEQISN